MASIPSLIELAYQKNAENLIEKLDFNYFDEKEKLPEKTCAASTSDVKCCSTQSKSDRKSVV